MKYDEIKYDKRKEINVLIANWLKNYSEEVIIKVLEKSDEIINNETTMDFLKELYERENIEKERFVESIDSLLSDFETFKKYNPHNHVLEHSKSYRDVLYDKYIRKI